MVTSSFLPSHQNPDIRPPSPSHTEKALGLHRGRYAVTLACRLVPRKGAFVILPCCAFLQPPGRKCWLLRSWPVICFALWVSEWNKGF